ncbi:MAG TPA: DUF2277 domain-containing protein [Bryobacteraceae bacterium]|jgi:hypothetical protein|nr:DUF2277 domain-containing protein [Bryobacteraceae bacterium]
MCRSIKVLRRADEPTTPEEFQKAALQYVRKISGFHKPSRANQESFERAVKEIAAVSERLLEEIDKRSQKAVGELESLRA